MFVVSGSERWGQERKLVWHAWFGKGICVNVGLEWGGAVGVGVWSVPFATHLDTLCLCRLVSIPLSVVCVLSLVCPVL